MKRLLPMLSMLLIFACGKSADTPETPASDTLSKDSSVVSQVPQIPEDKSYLSERPDKHPDFMRLSASIPFAGKVATKKDVEQKRAVFHMESKGKKHRAAKVTLPFYGYLTNAQHSKAFVIVLQAEILEGDTLYGFKDARGAMGICNSRELEKIRVRD